MQVPVMPADWGDGLAATTGTTQTDAAMGAQEDGQRPEALLFRPAVCFLFHLRLFHHLGGLFRLGRRGMWGGRRQYRRSHDPERRQA